MNTVKIEKTGVHTTLTTWLYCSFAMAWAAENLDYTKMDDQIEYKGEKYMLYGNIIPDL